MLDERRDPGAGARPRPVPLGGHDEEFEYSRRAVLAGSGRYNAGVTRSPFDAVLVVAFGGPLGPADVRPFLANVLRGRRVTPERVEEVAHHYDLFGGVSPLTGLTRAQADGLATRLRAWGHDLPVYVGMRNWHPFLADTLAEMSRAGIRRAVGFIAAAHRSYSSCTQYRENVRDARAALREAGLPDVEVLYAGDWHLHHGFVEANASRVLAALDRLAGGLRARADLVFTAHSIPRAMAEQYPYQAQYEATAAAIAGRVRTETGLALPHTCVYQSRSGRPEDPWLEPDICDYLRAARARGVETVVICPAGFICDHIEVLYDLDTEAAAVARDLGLPLVRAESVNDHPAFLDTMADVVLQTVSRYQGARPLPLVPA
jgi:protoporphyrin/coproporphyrin ferrochelatase